MNPKIEKLCSTIVDYSLEVKPNDRVLITYQHSKCSDLVKCLIKKITDEKAIPFVKMIDASIEALLMENTTSDRVEEIRKRNLFEVENYDCFINIRYLINDYENKNVDPRIRREIGEATKDIDYVRINERRWVLLNYPSMLDAYKAKMPADRYFNYALDVMNVDYEEMYERIRPLQDLMQNTDKVRITAQGTDLNFSIKNIPIIPCCGKSNIPDGEIYTAPVKDSVNGTITYNTPCPYLGNVYHDVKLVFENGKIIQASCAEDSEQLNKIFDTDEGSRYIGEFSLGLNPLILKPMGDILFDEKIIGSLHFTPGRAYKDADNGNVSSIHWDMVLVQRKEYGGGNIYFDDVLVRENGLFVLPKLKHLNYDLK
jgi:aminopeptidase